MAAVCRFKRGLARRFFAHGVWRRLMLLGELWLRIGFGVSSFPRVVSGVLGESRFMRTGWLTGGVLLPQPAPLPFAAKYEITVSDLKE